MHDISADLSNYVGYVHWLSKLSEDIVEDSLLVSLLSWVGSLYKKCMAKLGFVKVISFLGTSCMIPYIQKDMPYTIRPNHTHHGCHTYTQYVPYVLTKFAIWAVFCSFFFVFVFVFFRKHIYEIHKVLFMCCSYPLYFVII